MGSPVNIYYPTSKIAHQADSNIQSNPNKNSSPSANIAKKILLERQPDPILQDILQGRKVTDLTIKEIKEMSEEQYEAFEKELAATKQEIHSQIEDLNSKKNTLDAQVAEHTSLKDRESIKLQQIKANTLITSNQLVSTLSKLETTFRVNEGVFENLALLAKNSDLQSINKTIAEHGAYTLDVKTGVLRVPPGAKDVPKIGEAILIRDENGIEHQVILTLVEEMTEAEHDEFKQELGTILDAHFAAQNTIQQRATVGTEEKKEKHETNGMQLREGTSHSKDGKVVHDPNQKAKRTTAHETEASILEAASKEIEQKKEAQIKKLEKELEEKYEKLKIQYEKEGILKDEIKHLEKKAEIVKDKLESLYKMGVPTMILKIVKNKQNEIQSNFQNATPEKKQQLLDSFFEEVSILLVSDARFQTLSDHVSRSSKG